MSDIKHTAEPWFVRSQGWDGQFIYGYDSRVLPNTEPRFIAEVSLMYDGAEANAARIVSCVNACKGMSDPASSIHSLRQQLADTQQKLEAVKATFYVNMLNCYPEKSHAEIQDAIDRAIEQGKGGDDDR